MIWFDFWLNTLSTRCISYMILGNFKGRGNQYILVGQMSELKSVVNQ